MSKMVEALNRTAFSHLVSQAKRPNSKFISRGEDRSPLKYIINVLLLDFEYFIEKKFGLSTRVWISVRGGPKFILRGQILRAKSVRKCYHGKSKLWRHFGGLSPLEFDH